MDDIWTEAVPEFEGQTGLPKGFVWSLVQESDWGLVIKLHALYETALTNMLATKFRSDKLEEPLAKVSMEQKIELCGAVELLDKEDRRMLKALSRLRNRLVHSVREVGFNFADYLRDENRRKDFIENFAEVWLNPVKIKEQTTDRETFAAANPRLTVWAWSRRILVWRSLVQEKHKFEAQKLDWQKQTSERFVQLMRAFKPSDAR